MKRQICSASAILATAIMLTGCGELLMYDEGKSGGLVPPSASGSAAAFAPIQAPVYPPMPAYNANMMNPAQQNSGSIQNQRVANMTIDKLEIRNMPGAEQAPAATPNFQRPSDDATPLLTPDNSIEISAIGMGVAPENTISPSQALALAKRAAIIDAYRQIGEKIYGVRVNGQDTVKDMVSQNSTIKTRVQALIKNAEITETTFKDGLCQVNMVVRLDGRIWHKILNQS